MKPCPPSKRMEHLNAALWSLPAYDPSFEPETPEINVELEVIDFLRGLVRLLKPKIVVETGSYCGLTAAALAKACKDNGYGHVFTSDVDFKAYKATYELLDRHNLHAWATVTEGPALECLPIRECDLLFSDSSYDSRKEEVLMIKPGAVGVLHDTGMEDFLDLHVRSHYPGSVFIPTPRGLTIFQKGGA